MSSITLITSELRLALSTVIPHAHPKFDIPKCNTVHFEVVDGHLLVVATDRYTLAACRLGENWNGEDLGEFDVTLNLDDVKRLVQFAAAGHSVMEITLSVGESQTGGFTAFRFGASMTSDVAPDGFTDWKQILFGALRRELIHDGNEAAEDYNPLQLARFAKAARSKNPVMRFERGAGRTPTLVTGENFAGLIMPIKNDDNSAREAWITDMITPKITDKRVAS